jgi:hypothetical protein
VTLREFLAFLGYAFALIGAICLVGFGVTEIIAAVTP